MKRYTYRLYLAAIVIVLGLLTYFLLVSRTESIKKKPEPVRYRSITPNSGQTREQPNRETTTKLTSAIALNPDETLLDLYAYNIDFEDEEDEQILVVRRTNDSAGKLRVVLADYSPLTRRWTRAWEGETLATKIKTFQLSIQDLIGDHNLNIICQGINESNEQTMTVFWKSNDAKSAQGLYFSTVFAAAGNNVELQTTERPESYKLGQSNAESFPILLWRADGAGVTAPAGALSLDKIKETWNWDFSLKSYKKTSEEKITGSSTNQLLVDSILDGNIDTFTGFLDGIWYKESIDPLTSQALFITFQIRDKTLFFSGEGSLELFQWETSDLNRYGIYISCRNQSVQNLRRLINIELSSPNSIAVNVFQDLRIKAEIAKKWDGTYRRLSDEIAKSSRKPPSTAVESKDRMTGAYSASDGSILNLDYPNYSLNASSQKEEGIYTVFSISGTTVLDMRSIKVNDKDSVTRHSYSVESVMRTTKDGRVMQTLTLAPVTVGIMGLKATNDEPTVYERSVSGPK